MKTRSRDEGTGGTCLFAERPARGEGGFALPAVLLALLALSTMAAAGFVASNTDYRISQNHTASIHAFYASDGGLRDFIATQATASDTVSYTFGRSTATVWGEKLIDLEANGPALYLLPSQGVYTAPEGGISNQSVSAVVLSNPSGISLWAAFTAPAGLHKNGTSGDVSGYDQATADECTGAPVPAVAGVKVPTGGYTQSGGGKKGWVPEGDPPIDESKSGLEHLQETGIDWDGIVNGGLVTPDYIVNTIDDWPDWSDIGPDEWPIIYIDSPVDFKLGNTKTLYRGGRGLIIVRNDLTMNGNPPGAVVPVFEWEGVILVGGGLTLNGNTETKGAVVAGLNLLLGESPGGIDIANGTKEIMYHSCNLKQAVRSLSNGTSVLIEEPGTWSESM